MGACVGVRGGFQGTLWRCVGARLTRKSEPACEERLQARGQLALLTAAEAAGAEVSRMKVQQEFIAAGVNRVVGALAWSEQGSVAFGAHHMVVLYDHKVSPSPHRVTRVQWGSACRRAAAQPVFARALQSAEMVATLIGHGGLVGCVAWVPPHRK